MRHNLGHKKIHTKVAGRYKLQALKLDSEGNEIEGSRRELTPWFENLITDAGLNYIAENFGWLSWCQVGSGSNAPNVADTALQTLVASSSTQQATSQSIESTAPYFLSRQVTIRFAEGVAEGNLSEVGIGWGSSGSLFSRALILDSGGSPTTITVLADETLDVTYELRFYMPTSDFESDSSGLTLTGNIGGTYDWIFRASAVTTLSQNAGWWTNSNGFSFQTGISFAAYSGDISAITGAAPAGTVASGATCTPQAYSSDSFERTYSLEFGLNQGNLAGGLRSIKGILGCGAYQIQFEPKIPKTSSDILALTLSVSWGRV